jgi:catechol 2,3-dioxygenase-like lactoylglutathione lyase family enzyme
VRARLIAASPPERHAEIQQVLERVSGEIAASADKPRDYSEVLSELLRDYPDARLFERELAQFAAARDFERTVAALSLIAAVPAELVERLMTGERLEPVLILCRAVRFKWPTALLRARRRQPVEVIAGFGERLRRGAGPPGRDCSTRCCAIGSGRRAGLDRSAGAETDPHLVLPAPHDPAAAVNFRPLRQHENELLRQPGKDARRQGKAGAGIGHVAQVARADRFAVLGTDEYIPPQSLSGTASAIDRHGRNLRYVNLILFAKKLTAGYLLTAGDAGWGKCRTGGTMPKLDRVLETALYVDDLGRAAAFYADVLELPSLYADERLRAFAVGPSVLLLFRRGASLDTMTSPGGTIPPHDGSGPLHVAFATGADALAQWEERLRARGIPIEGRTEWSRGGRSIYFRDRDGHLLELATPGLWRNY